MRMVNAEQGGVDGVGCGSTTALTLERRASHAGGPSSLGHLSRTAGATICGSMIDFEFRPAQAVVVGQQQLMDEDAHPSGLPPRGWYGDPASSEPFRYWTGTAWADGGTDDPPQ